MSDEWPTAFRTMLAGSTESLPACGSEPSMLGVRPKTDVRVDEDGTVTVARNERRGLSVAPRPENLHPAHRPIGLKAGESRLPCWKLSPATLSAENDRLHLAQTSEVHGVVTTTEDVEIDELQRRLCDTKDRWKPWK